MIHLGADARLLALDLQLGRAVFEALALRLFTNDLLPDDAEVARDYVELEGHGYAEAVLDPEQWITTPGDLLGGRPEPALAVYPKVLWTFQAGPPVAVFGYFVAQIATQRLVWSERFVREQIVEFEGDNIAVVPTFRLRGIEVTMLPPIQDGDGA